MSVIVPVRTGARQVEARVPQTLPRERFEVLIDDDESTDGAIEPDKGREFQ